jgi:hypothetical protein
METPQTFQTGIPRALRRSASSAAFSVVLNEPTPTPSSLS